MSRALPSGDFDWLLNLGKAIRDAVLVGLVGAGAVLIGVLSGVFEADKLAELGVPVWAIPVAAAAFTSLRNYLRIRWGWPVVIAMLSLLGAGATPAHASEALRKVLVEPIVSPHLVVGVSVNQNAPAGESKYSVIATANILGPRLGSIFCNVGGAGVGLETIAPGLEDVSIARVSFPVLTCAPFGEKVVLQAGIAKPIGGINASDEIPYFGVGVNLAASQAEQDVKRAARIAAKKQKALLDLQDQAQGRTASAQ